MDKEYIELEPLRDEILYDPNFDSDTINYFIGIIDSKPIADVVEVVRYKDCLFGHRDYDYEYGYTCVKPLYHPGIGEMPHRKLMQDCDYCSHGVRKEE